MEEIKFLVKGSTLKPFLVMFAKRGTNLTALCTCPAGQKGQHCEHGVEILRGSAKGVMSSNLKDVGIVESWLPGSDVEDALLKVSEAEAYLDSAKKLLSAAKRELAQALRD